MRVVLIISFALTFAAGPSFAAGPTFVDGAPSELRGVASVPEAARSGVRPGSSAVVRSDSTVRYRPPVDGEITDPFRAPDGPYGAGNRGLEYATSPGSPARAIGAGTVAFSGPVAGRAVVSIVHPDGLRSSLTGLASTSVVVGDVVEVGDVVGTTNASLHLGVRRDDDYIDPASLFAAQGSPRHAVLVPLPR